MCDSEVFLFPCLNAFRLHSLQPRQISRALVLLSACLFAAASSLAQTKETTTTQLQVSTNATTGTTVPVGTMATLTASAQVGQVVFTNGRIIFCDTAITASCSELTRIGSAQLGTSSHSATLKFFPGAGTHNYVAQFIGNTGYTSSTSTPQTLTVTASNTTQTTLAAVSGTTSLNASVAATGGSLSPTGSISLIDLSNKNTPLASNPLSQATTAFSLSLTSSPSTLGQEPSQIASADFNGDGIADLALPNTGQPGQPQNGGPITILLGNGNGTFNAGPILTTATHPSVVAIGDFNNDGFPDLAIDGGGSGQLQIFLNTGDGSGSFAPAITPIASPITSLASIISADLNDDGNLDLIVCTYNTSGQLNPLTILLGNGTGAFTTAATPPLSPNAFATAVGDFNGDGIPDIIVRNSNYPNPETITLLIGKGDGTFTASATSLASNSTNSQTLFESVLVGDFNGDGKADIVLSNIYGASGQPSKLLLTTYLGNGDGTFSAPINLQTSDATYSFGMAVADFNADGKTDIAIVDDTEVAILLSKGDGTFTTAASATGATTGPDVDTVVIADLNGDGVPDIAQADSDRQAASIYLSSRSSTTPIAFTNFAIPGSGTHNIQANYSGDASFKASTSNSVGVAASLVPTTLALISSASSITTGQQVVLTATLTPYTQDTLTTNGESITFFSGSKAIGTATLSSGVAILNTTSIPAGSSSLTASYSSDGNFAASTSSAVPITVTVPAAPAITLSPGSLTFATQSVGTTSSAQIVSVANSGTAPLTISAIAITGPFAQTNNCGTGLAPSATCSISITFTPSAGGTATGILTIADNAPNSPQAVTLTGSGTGIALSATATSLNIAIPGGSIGTTVLVSALSNFTGTVSLTCAVSFQGTGTPNDLPTCTVTPPQANISAATPITASLTVSTTAASSSAVHNELWRGPGIALAALLFFGLVPRRRFRGPVLFCILGLAAIGGILTGCGGGSPSTPPPNNPPANPGTTVGNYTVTLTATSGTATATASLPLTLQ